MELLDADLRDLLDGPALISNEHIKYIMYQLLHAVRHLHAASITHRDIKPENILLNEDGQVKLCDFGLARGCNFLEVNNTARFSNNYVQTRYYRAPELLLDCDLVGTGVDIWSVGCIFGEMLGGGGILFTGSSSANQLKKIIRTMGTPSMDEVGSEKGRFFVNSLDYVEKNEEWYFDVLPRHCVDMYALDLLCKLLAFDPKKRITAEQALRHPYFRNIDLDIKPVQISKFCFDYEKSLFVANTQDEERFASLCKRECYETIVGFHKRSGDKRQLSTKKSFKQTLRELFKTKK
jgi:serine/threonine protein kinase